MKLTALGKLAILMIVVGVSIGGWRVWQLHAPSTGPVSTGVPASSTPAPTPSDAASPNMTSAPTDSQSASASGSVLFVYSDAKKDWAKSAIDKFNASGSGRPPIVGLAVPSRKSMHDILDGASKPVLWSPDDPIWPNRLVQAEREKGQTPEIDMNDPAALRVFLRSPIVFLTTREKSRFLQPLLGGAGAWDRLHDLSSGRARVPWGSFRYSYANPLESNSGMLTLGLILASYSAKRGGDLKQDARSPGFGAWLDGLSKSYVYDDPAKNGTTALFNAFKADPSKYDVITAYESDALGAAGENHDLAVIYPNPTAVAQHAIAQMNAGWVTSDQKAVAAAFLTFLATPDEIKNALRYHFRPGQAAGGLTIDSQIEALQLQGFRDSYSSIELPPYPSLNDAAFQWRTHVAHLPATGSGGL